MKRYYGKRKGHVHFGSVVLVRRRCSVCGHRALSAPNDPDKCHGLPMEPIPERPTRVGNKRDRRTKMSKQRQNYLLSKQDWRCYWCNRRFGAIVTRRKRKSPHDQILTLRPVGDHYFPYCATLSCKDDQFVLACQICNAFKSDYFVEDDEKLLRDLIARKWRMSDWSEVLDCITSDLPS